MRVARPLVNRTGEIISVLFVFLALVSAQPAAFGQLGAQPAPQPLVAAVGALGMTVSDMDRSVEFFSKVLSFEKVSDVEVAGDAYEHLAGVFGLRMRVVRLRLGDEDRKSTRLNSSHIQKSRMPSSA